MSGPDTTPVADQLAKARTALVQATTAAKLATAKRARLAAEVRALEAEAEIEAMRIQARADRERAAAAEARADAAEAALAAERAAHLAEEREHAADVERLKHASAPKRATGRKTTVATNGNNGPGEAPAVVDAAAVASAGPSEPAQPDPVNDRAD